MWHYFQDIYMYHCKIDFLGLLEVSPSGCHHFYEGAQGAAQWAFKANSEHPHGLLAWIISLKFRPTWWQASVTAKCVRHSTSFYQSPFWYALAIVNQLRRPGQVLKAVLFVVVCVGCLSQQYSVGYLILKSQWDQRSWRWTNKILWKNEQDGRTRQV